MRLYSDTKSTKATPTSYNFSPATLLTHLTVSSTLLKNGLWLASTLVTSTTAPFSSAALITLSCAKFGIALSSSQSK